MSRSQLVRLALALTCVLAFAVEASARTETLRWMQRDDPSTIAGFRVHWRTANGSTSRTEDIGLPARGANGVYTASVVVDDSVDVLLSMTAYNADNVSSFASNEICRGPGVPCATTPPPDPTDPPPGGGGGGGGDPTPGSPQAQITGFRLWDARSDTIIDNSFVSGETIPLLQYDCVAIEIVGNSYLNGGYGGSVKKVLDGSSNVCNAPGSTHENSPPFAWEADEGPGRFVCATTLRASGPHTLTVTPYDGPDCTGDQGTPVTLQFQTLSLGAPGRPELVQ